MSTILIADDHPLFREALRGAVHDAAPCLGPDSIRKYLRGAAIVDASSGVVIDDGDDAAGVRFVLVDDGDAAADAAAGDGGGRVSAAGRGRD